MAAAKSGERLVRDLLKERVFGLPIYFLQGEEPYFLDEATSRIQDSMPEAERGFNLSVLFGRDVDMQTVLADARQFPFLGERRILLVKEAQMMDSLTRGDDGQSRLLTYLDHIQATTTLVFSFKGKTLDGRKPLAAKLKNAGFLFNSPKLADWDSAGLESMVMDMCHQAELKIDKQGVARLAQFVGNDLSRMANEVAKLKVAVPTGTTVTQESVLTYIGVSRDYSIFEFQKALATKDFTMAVKLATYYSNNEKEHPLLKELAFLTSFFTKLLVQKAQRLKGGSSGNEGYRPNQDTEKALQAYSLPQLIHCIHLLAEADLMAKGAGQLPMDTADIWPWLVYRIFEG